MNPIQKATEEFAMALLRHKERVIREYLDSAVPGWALADITSRMRIEICHNPDRELVYLDEKPVLIFYPVQFDTDSRQRSVEMLVSRRWARL